MAQAKNEPESASVKLMSFCLYRLHGSPGSARARLEVVAGASDARFGPDGKIQLLASSVPFRSKQFKKYAPKPGAGILALYGHRDALDELQYWRGQARLLKADFAWAEFEVLVKEISTQLVDREMLKTNRTIGFLNLRRCQAKLQTEIQEKFAEYVLSDGGKPDREMARVAQIATRPDLFTRLLQDDPDLRNVSVVVTPVADDPEVPGRTRQLAFVRAGSTVTKLVQGGDQYEILLPQWLTDKTAARKLLEPSTS